MSWIENLREELGDNDIDFSNESTILYGIFKNVTHPQISLTENGRLVFPEQFYIQMGGCQSLFRLLKQPELFFSLTFSLKKAILDLLYLLMNKNIYNVIRLQFSDNIFASTAESSAFSKLFLRLLEISMKQNDHQIIISRKIVRLFGLASSIGMSQSQMRKFLTLLRTPSPLTIYLLHAMNAMFQHDFGNSKAFPSSFFTFGGPGAGLFTSLSVFPFVKEYQICTWFRSEDITATRPAYDPNQPPKAFNTSANTTQHIVSWHNPSQKGLDVYIDGNILIVAVSNQSKIEPTLIKITDHPLKKGVWYHLSIRHSKPKVSFFGNDELTVHLDQDEVFNDNFRFPNLGTFVDTDFAIGRNFNGQIGPVYFLNDTLHPSAVSIIAKLDAGRGYDLYNSNLEIIPADLIRTVVGPDKKPHSIAPKLTMSYHPNRCHNGFAIDIHSGRHAAFGNYSQPWNIVNPRELLVTMGGISCLIPLFPKLLVETEIDRHYLPIRDIEGSSSAIQFGVPPPPSPEPTNSPMRHKLTGNPLLEDSVLQLIKSKEDEEIQGIGLIGVLISIFAKSIKAHRVFQQQLLDEGGIEMIEYVLQCVPTELLQIEGDRCVIALSQLRGAASDCFLLEMKLLKCLLCNIRLWNTSSFALVSNLLPLIIAEIKAKPDKVSKLLTIYELLECLSLFEPTEIEYSNRNGEEIDSVISSENLSVAKVVMSMSLSTELITSPQLVNIKDIPADLRNEGKVTEELQDDNSGHRAISLKEALRQTSDSNRSVDFTQPSPAVSLRSMRTVNSAQSTVKRMKSFKLALTEIMAHNDEEEEADDTNHLTNNDSNEGVSPNVSSEHTPAGKDPAINLSEDLEYEHRQSIVSPDEADEDPIEESPETNQSRNEAIKIEIIPKTNPQKKQIRDLILSIILLLIKYNPVEKEVMAFIDYLAECKSKTVLNELANVLLHLIVDSGPRITPVILLACGGAEEFASFVLVYLIHQPLEALRCIGVRILTHFYSKSDQVPLSSAHLSAKRKKKPLLLQEKFNLLINSNNGLNNHLHPQGLERLQLCGGLALLCEIISSHCKQSTAITYSALLELLLTKYGMMINPYYIQYTDTTMDQIIANSLTSANTPNNNTNSIGANNNGKRGGSVYQILNRVQQPLFAAHYLAQGDSSRDDIDMTNTIVLPIFFELLPKLPIQLFEQIFSDLLVLLKHSEGNCEAFCASPSWHLCMFGLVQPLVDSTRPLQHSRSFHTYEMVSELEQFTGIHHSKLPLFNLHHRRSKQKILELKREESSSLIRSWSMMKATGNNNNEKDEEVNRFRSTSFYSSKINEVQMSQNFDLWFDLGMKIYSTLLSHAIECKNGWKEIDRSVSSSFQSEIGYSIAQTILSHLLNDLTFTMKSKYKELQRLVRSTNSSENQSATEKLENFLSILLTSADVAFINQQTIFLSIPDQPIALLRIQVYNELSKELRNARSEKVFEVEGISFTDKEVMLPFSTVELRKIYADTEIKMREKIIELCSVRPDDEQSTTNKPDYEDGGEEVGKLKSIKKSIFRTVSFEEDLINQNENEVGEEDVGGEGNDKPDNSLDLFHIWYDIASDSSSSFFAGSGAAQNQRRESLNREKEDMTVRKADNLLTNNTNQIFRTTEELLHPLERIHEIYHGKLIIVLQSLRLFDVIFWPTEESTIRNNEMLRFSKELLKQQQQSQSTGSGDNNNNSNGTSEPRKQMTIFSATLRMCIFTLVKLSPTTHLAVHNIKRMRALVRNLDKVSSYNTPTYDWLLAVLCHVTINIQRLMMALEPAFEMIGINDRLHIPLMGPWSDSYDEYDSNTNPLPSDERERIFQAMNDVDLLQSLHQYFNSSLGRNLIRNIRASLHLLIDCFTFHSGKLSSAMEERMVRALGILVEQMRADSQIIQQLPPELINSTTTGGLKALKKYNSLNRFEGNYAIDSGNGDIYDGGVGGSNSSYNGSNAPSSPLGFLQNLRNRSQSDQSDVSTASFAVEGTPAAVEGKEREHTPLRGRAQTEKGPAPPSAGSAYASPPEKLASNSVDTSFVEETFNGYDILMMLKWLRYPFFRFNILRNIQILKSLQALDYLESRSIYRFSWESQIFKQELEDHRDLAIKSLEEMNELKELSREVSQTMITRQAQRSHAVRLQENLKIRKVAQRWNDCLEDSEIDWSPWKQDLNSYYHDFMQAMNAPNSRNALHGIAYYELSKHRDLSFRNMIMIKLSEPIDHKENAYLDSKVKDNLLYNLSNTLSSSIEVDPEGLRASFEAIGEERNHETAPTITASTDTVLLVSWKDRDKDNNNNIPAADNKGKFKIPQINAKSNNNATGAELFDENNDDVDESKSDSNVSDGTNITSNNTSDLPMAGFAAEVSKTLVTFFQVGNDERISQPRPLWTHLFRWQSDERTLYMADVTKIQLDQTIAGTLLLTNRCVYFHYKKRLGGLANKTIESSSTSSSALLHAQSDKRWYLDRLIEVYGRRYLSQNCAIELFFADSSEVFLAFTNYNELSKFFKLLRNQNTPLLSTTRSLNPRYAYKHSIWTELWRRRQMSNFDYLMKLNILAGRSHNDITQYPVFPWILSNYHTETIDLSKTENYRNLSKPIGALNEERLKEFKERYNSFYDDTIPKFMYGSHYSSAGVVLHYMVRQEPYTTLAINLQSGRFDCPDRIFFNLSKTWSGCNHSMSDVKELIPEMFYSPEIFINSNRLPLGELQDGNIVDHVTLPPWCQNNPYEFIRIHREALESEYVSEHLSEWIDLIFGYKQRGDAALAANNVFYYLTYENSIDVSAIEDPLQRAATKSQVIHFGQTPSQLLNREHPKRLPREDCILPLCSYDLKNISNIQIFQPYTSHQSKGSQFGSLLAIRCFTDKVIFFYQNYALETFRWSPIPDHEGNPFTMKLEKNVRTLPVLSLSMAENVLKGIHIINQSYSNYYYSSHHQNHSPSTASSSSSLSSLASSSAGNGGGNGGGGTSLSAARNSRISIDNSNLTSGTIQMNVEKRGSESEESHKEGTIEVVRSVSKQYEEDNDLVSPPFLTNSIDNTTNSNTSGGQSVFASLKNSFFGRKKSWSMNLTSTSSPEVKTKKDLPIAPAVTSVDSSHPSLPPPINTANKTKLSQNTETSTSLYNAVRLDQKLHPEKKMSPHHLPHPTTNSSSTSKRRPSQQYSILDTCYNGLTPLSSKFITMNDAETFSQSRIISIGYWDNTVKVHAADSLKEIASVSSGHIGAITCIESGLNNHGPIFVTGGFEGTIRVWVLEKPAYASAFKQESFYAEPLPQFDDNPMTIVSNNPGSSSAKNNPSSLVNTNDLDGSTSSSLLSCIHVLCGHTSPISALSYCQDADVVFSGGTDGLLCLHTIRSGQYVRCMTEMIGSSIDMILASKNGYLIAHSWTSLQVSVFWLNGQLLFNSTLSERIECMITSHHGNVLIIGFHSGILSFRTIWNLEEIHSLNLSIYGAIKALWFSEDSQYLFVGSEDGTFSIATDPTIRMKAFNSALQKSPYLV